MRGLAVCVLSWILATSGGHAATFDELAAAAAAARRGNKLPEAIELYRQALGLKADWQEGWWFLGTLSYSLFRYADCEGAFTQFVKLDDSRVLGWALLGLCEFETGNYEGSLAHIERGLAPGSGLAPEVDAGVRFHRGLLLTRAGLFDQGRRELERFVRGSGEPMLIAGMGLNALRLPLLPKDIPVERQNLILAAGRATCFWISGDQSRAEKEFGELLNGYPSAPNVHYLYGTYLGMSHPEQARVQFQRELEVNPESAEAHAMLALMLIPGDAAATLANAKKAASERPSDPLIEYAYGKALVATGALAEGIERLETAERLDPEALTYHMALASAYSKAGRHEDARRERLTSKAMAKGQGGSN